MESDERTHDVGEGVAVLQRPVASSLTVAGTVLIVLGAVRVLVVLELLPDLVARVIAAGWPAVIVAAGVWWLATGRRVTGAATVLVGSLLLVLTAVPDGLTMPVLLIGLGLLVLLGSIGGRRWVLGGSAVALFDSVRADRSGSPTRSYVAVFGESTGRLDPDQVGDGQVECLAVFGDVEVRVPADVAVTLSETAVFGDVRAPVAAARPIRATVPVRATSVFGDVRLVRE